MASGKIGDVSERIDVGLSIGAQDDYSGSWSVGVGIDCGQYLDLVLGYGEIEGDTGNATIDDNIDDEVTTFGIRTQFSF